MNDRSPADFYAELRAAWSAQSSSSWTPGNPAKGQCSVTSLIVQDVFGGEILSTQTPGGTHFYNSINGVRWDFTVSQFAAPIPFEDTPSSRDEAFNDTSPEQYAHLRQALGLSS
jgi:hypothetical protein